MNSDQENQNQSVNYDFITNQGAELPVSGKKPKDRRLIIIGILGVISLVMIIMLGVSTNKTVQQSATNQQVAEQHIKYISENQMDEAIKLYVNYSQIDAQAFQVFWNEIMAQKYDLSNCASSKVGEKDGKKTVEMFCPFQDSSQGRILTYKIEQQTGLIEEVSDVYQPANS